MKDLGWLFPPFPLLDATRRDQGVRLVDVDGDALPDLVKALATLSGSDPATATHVLTSDSGVYRNTGAGFEPSPSAAWRFPDVPLQAGVMPFSLAWIQGGASHTTGLDIADVSGDGVADLVGARAPSRSGHGSSAAVTACRAGTRAARGGGFEPVPDAGDLFDDGFWGLNRSGIIDISYFLQPSAGTTSGNARFADLDGDGLPELVVRGLEDRYTAFGGPDPLFAFSNLRCVDARRTNYYYANRGGLRFERAPVVDAAAPDCASGIQRTAIDFQHCDLSDSFGCAYEIQFNQTYPMRFSGDPFVGTLPWYWITNHELGVLDVDLNGDGLTDTLSATNGSAIGYGSVSTAWINDGRRGYAEQLGWRLPNGLHLYQLALHHSVDTGTRLADVNGDGRVDVVQAKGTEPPRFWLNAGGPTALQASAWRPTSAWQLPEGIAFADAEGRDTSVRLVDVNGDGMTDIVRSFGDESEVHLNRGSTPDLLIGVETPTGGTTQWSYVPSTTAMPPAPPTPPIPFVVPLVATVTTDASPGMPDSAPHVTRYAYEGGSWDADRRELRGFERVVETRPDGARVLRSYATDAALRGKLRGERIEDAAGALWLAYDYEYVPQPVAPPWSALLARVRRHEQDGMAGPPRTTLTEYRYDALSSAHGAPAAVVEFGAVGAGDLDLVPGDSRTTEFEFVANDAKHLVDRLKARRLRRGTTPGAGVVERETRFYYDGDTTGNAAPTRGLLTRRVDVLGEPGRPDPTVTWSYDVYGNPTAVTDARANAGEGGGTTLTEYDAVHHTFPSAVVNALGHRTEYAYATASWLWRRAECGRRSRRDGARAERARLRRELASLLRRVRAHRRRARARGSREHDAGAVTTPARRRPSRSRGARPRAACVRRRPASTASAACARSRATDRTAAGSSRPCSSTTPWAGSPPSARPPSTRRTAIAACTPTTRSGASSRLRCPAAGARTNARTRSVSSPTPTRPARCGASSATPSGASHAWRRSREARPSRRPTSTTRTISWSAWSTITATRARSPTTVSAAGRASRTRTSGRATSSTSPTAASQWSGSARSRRSCGTTTSSVGPPARAVSRSVGRLPGRPGATTRRRTESADSRAAPTTTCTRAACAPTTLSAARRRRPTRSRSGMATSCSISRTATTRSGSCARGCIRPAPSSRGSAMRADS